VHEFAFDERFKLYRSRELFDLDRDPEERNPIPLGRRAGDAAAAATRLETVLEQFEDARPAALDARAPGAAKESVGHE
jgi:hypothetical protein